MFPYLKSFLTKPVIVPNKMLIIELKTLIKLFNEKALLVPNCLSLFTTAIFLYEKPSDINLQTNSAW